MVLRIGVLFFLILFFPRAPILGRASSLVGFRCGASPWYILVGPELE